MNPTLQRSILTAPPRARRHLRPPEVEFAVSTADAFRLASWYCDYALDRLPSDERIFHTGVSSHGTSAHIQLGAVVGLLERRFGQPSPPER